MIRSRLGHASSIFKQLDVTVQPPRYYPRIQTRVPALSSLLHLHRPLAASYSTSAPTASSSPAASSSSSSATSSPPPIKPARKRPSVLLSTLIAGLGAAYIWDEYLQERVLQRNLFTAYTGLAIALDYKLNFDPDDPHAVAGLHERCADRLFRACELNQGLYIKLAQAVGANAIILPPAYMKFTKLFDDVDRMPWDVVKRVVVEELATKGKTMEQVFSSFTEKPVAAASVAQVHKATLRSTGQEVAVKVQRPSIRVQTYWDLLSFRILLRFYERIFDLPLSYFGGYISDQIELETHFDVELRNAQRIQEYIRADSSISQTVTVPTCVPEVSSDRLLVMDWIEGAVKMTDRAKIEDMGLSVRNVASDVCNVFAAMIFNYGLVQCDGHAGNVLVRQHPNGKKGQHQVVLIDHGLYVELSDKFRREYAQLWKSIFTVDTATLEKITHDWGMGKDASELFASATLMRPWSNPKKRKPQDPNAPKMSERERYHAQVNKQKEVIKNFLDKVELVPKELIFVGRSMRIIQANNQTLGSPVNRINILARHAADALIATSPSPSLRTVFFSRSRNRSSDTPSTFPQRLSLYISSGLAFLRFRSTLFLLDAAFVGSGAFHWFQLLGKDPLYAIGWRSARDGDAGGNFEDDLEKGMQRLARDELGVELKSEAFQG